MNAGNVANRVIGQTSAEVEEVTEMLEATGMVVAATDATADPQGNAADHLNSDDVKAAVVRVRRMMVDRTKWKRVDALFAKKRVTSKETAPIWGAPEEVVDSKIAEETTEVVAEIFVEETTAQEAGHPQEELKGREETTHHPARLHAEGTILRVQDPLVASPQGKTVTEMRVKTSPRNIDTLN